MFCDKEYLKLLHPVAPFITEKLFQNNPLKDAESIMVSKFPKFNSNLENKNLEEEFEILKNVISSVNLKAVYNLSSKKINAVIVSDAHFDILNESKEHISKLAFLDDVKVLKDANKEDLANSIRAVHYGVEVIIPAKGVIEVDKEIERFSKKLEATVKELEGINENFQIQIF